MNEVINSILKAEAKAVEVVSTANDKSKKMIIAGEEVAEKIKAQAIIDFKKERCVAIFEAENKATEVYNSEINKGIKKADDLKKSCEDKVDEIADEVIRRMFS